MCMICTCEFSLTWRRHHCRACGKVKWTKSTDVLEKNVFVILHRISKRQIIRYVHFLDDWSLFPYQVVCQSCSSHKHRLRYLKNQLARVCDQCFHVFQQQKSKIDFQTFYYMDRKLLYLLFIVKKKRRKKSLGCTILCLIPAIFFWSSGETSQSAVVSPGSKTAFPFSRKQKKIPAALKEVAHTVSCLGHLSFLDGKCHFFCVFCVLGVRKHRQLYH